MPIDHNKRLNRIRKLLGLKTDVELADLIEAKQPQLSRWRKAGFSMSTGNLLDELVALISKLKREVTKLKKENKSLRQELDSKQ